MNSELLNLVRMPNANREHWLERAVQGVQFLEQSCKRNEQIVLFATGPHFNVQSILVPRAAVEHPNHDDIVKASIFPDNTWSIQRTYMGGEGHRVFIEPPLSNLGSRMLIGGEMLVFLRNFDGVKEYKPTIEVNQKLVHSLGVYYLYEQSAYCRLNKHGDIDKVITVLDDELPDLGDQVSMVTIRGYDLAKYMALSDTAIVIKFYINRFVVGEYPDWNEQEIMVFQERDLYYCHRVLPNHASIAIGHIIHRTDMTEEDLIEEWKAEEDTSTKQYASFKIFDFKNDRLMESSCGPGHTVNYHIESELPYEMSPAFFRPEVLQKYKQDPEKYTITDRWITCRNSWHIQSYGINEAGQVHAYICDLGCLPFTEQCYWQSFNEWPKNGISKREYQIDFLGIRSTEDDPLAEVKELIRSLDKKKQYWWKCRGKELVMSVLNPASDTIKEWGDEILALDHLVVEGFLVNGLRSIIDANNGTYEKEWRSLKLLETALSVTCLTGEQAKELVAPLRDLRHLRNVTKAHSNPHEKKEIANARKTYGTLRCQFKNLTSRVRDSMKQIVSILQECDRRSGPNP